MARFIICKASAGSGKTYTLVRQFIETAISSPSQLKHRFEHILAITFTNKAANGMKERILSQLHALSKGESRNLCEEIAKHLAITTEEVRNRCAVVQSAILHHYTELSVCTIDSFVHRLVRTFAHDLRLPMNFDVMIDNQMIIQSSVDQLLALAGTDGQETLTKVLCAYTESRMDSGKSYRLDNQIAKLANEIFKEETPEYLAKLEKVSLDDYIAIEKRLRKECRKTEEYLTSQANELIHAITQEGLTPDDFPYKRSGALAPFIRLAEGDYSKLNDTHTRADDAYTKERLWGKSTPAIAKSRMEAVMPHFKRVYKSVMDYCHKELVAYNSRQLMLRNLYGLALLSRLSQIKNDYYSENEIVHISEFNKRIAEEVMNEPTPFIYERIGSHYYNYLIDEFQDTSRLQWLNFLPLLDEAMTHSFSDDTALPGTQSLVVGDGKQAIYRFRQGDVRQFMMLPQVESNLHGLSLAANAKTEPLRQNYRTLSNIVEFNNRFFESVIRTHFLPSKEKAGNPELARLYIGSDKDADLIQTPVKEGGYVQIAFTERDAIYTSILDTIRHQVDDLGYKYGDIMILARDKETLVEISDHITGNNGQRPIPLVSSESFLLSNSEEVLLIQSLLEYIYNPKNRVAAVQALYLYIHTKRGADKQSADWELRDMDFNLEELFEKQLPHHSQHKAFDVEKLRTLPLYDLCETLIRIFDLDGNGNRHLVTLLNVVNNFVQNGGSSLGDFVAYLDEKIEKLSSATAADLDAVQLMTIHKAKGLESKIIIYAIPNKRAPNNKIWVTVNQKDENGEEENGIGLPVAYVDTCKVSTIFNSAFEEEARLNDMDRINILYVAMTRPEEKLFIFGEEIPWNEESTNNLALLHSFVMNDEKVTECNGIFTVGDDFATQHISSFNTPKPLGQSEVSDNSCASQPPTSDNGSQEDDGQQTISIPSIMFPEWENRVSIAQQSAALLSPLDEDNRRYGILIHDLLSQIRTAEEAEEVVKKYCKENELPQNICDDIKHRITHMIESDDNKRYFDGKCRVKCEVSIAVNGKVKRPDRIVFAENETFVVDFKTGARDEQSHKKYQHQVAEYAAALTAMGYPNVKPVIVYI